MPTIYKREINGKKVYYANITLSNGERIQRSLGTDQKSVAITKLRELERKLTDSSGAPTHQTTWEQALALVVRDSARQRSQQTINFYTKKIAHLKRIFTDEQKLPYIQDLTIHHINSYIKQRETETASSHTISKELRTLSIIISTLHAADLIPSTSKDLIPKYSANYTPKKDHLSLEQARALLTKLEPNRAAHVAFLIATGARWGESLRAKRSHIISNENLILIHIDGSKTHTSKATIPVVLDSFRELLVGASFAFGEDTLFTNWQNVRRDLHSACKRAGVPVAISPNTLRHTTAQWLLDAGATLDQTASVLRHATTAMVYRTYGKPDEHQLAHRIAQSVSHAKKS